MIAGIYFALCALAAWLQFRGKTKMHLDRGDVKRINRHFDKLHPGDGSPFE